MNDMNKTDFESSNFFKKFIWNAELKQLLISIMNSNPKEVEKYLPKLKELNPWKENFSNDSNEIQYNSLAKRDAEALKNFLEDTPTMDDYEQAFDGNFINPSVLVVGINPKYVEHDTYRLKKVYKNPFKQCRVPLAKKNKKGSKNNLIIKLETGCEVEVAKSDYYFGEKGFFYLYSNKEDKEITSQEKKVFDQHREQIFNPHKRTPFALLKLFPYASHNETSWLKDKKMSDEVLSYIRLEKLLYSQQWIFCLLAFVLKNNPTITVYFRKNSYDFILLMREFVRIGKFGEGIQYLTKANPNSQKISLANSRYFFSDLEDYSSNIEFFESIWTRNEEE